MIRASTTAVPTASDLPFSRPPTTFCHRAFDFTIHPAMLMLVLPLLLLSSLAVASPTSGQASRPYVTELATSSGPAANLSDSGYQPSSSARSVTFKRVGQKTTRSRNSDSPKRMLPMHESRLYKQRLGSRLDLIGKSERFQNRLPSSLSKEEKDDLTILRRKIAERIRQDKNLIKRGYPEMQEEIDHLTDLRFRLPDFLNKKPSTEKRIRIREANERSRVRSALRKKVEEHGIPLKRLKPGPKPRGANPSKDGREVREFARVQYPLRRPSAEGKPEDVEAVAEDFSLMDIQPAWLAKGKRSRHA